MSSSLRQRNKTLMHDRNPYKERRPDFAALALTDADFAKHVRYTTAGGVREQREREKERLSAIVSADREHSTRATRPTQLPIASWLLSHLLTSASNPLAGEAYLDWACPAATVALTRTLLWQDFQIRWELPAGCLCPTVPSRINYLLWLDDLLASRSSTPPSTKSAGAFSHSRQETPRPGVASSSAAAARWPAFGATARSGRQRVIDIGTGANCIYPLLGSALLGWTFLGTERDEVSVVAARRNVELNGWSDRIEVRAARGAKAVGSAADDPIHAATDPAQPEAHEDVQIDRDEPPILHGLLRPGEVFGACMCNPPFYDLHEQPRGRWHTASGATSTRCSATESEMFCTGGEVGFIRRLVRESLELRHVVGWYTSLVGRKASLAPLLRELRTHAVPRVETCELSQGTTSRWVLAWSFVEGPPCASAVVESQASAAAPLAAAGPDDSSGVHLKPPASKVARKVFAVGELSRAEITLRIDEAMGSHGAVTLPLSHPTGANEANDPLGLLACGFVPTRAQEDAQVLMRKRRREAPVAVSKPEAIPSEAEVESNRLFTFSLHWLASTSVTAEMATGDAGKRGAEERQGEKPQQAHVALELCGGSAAAFWRFSEQLRNDIVRDTRKWRRRLARE